MSVLEVFDQHKHGVLARSTIREISAVRLYYVIAGRNAWHSTWIQRYSSGCMHSSMQSAKAHAEKRRVQGTVFNIIELPAVVGRSENGAIVATQINENRPLMSYSPEAMSETHPRAKLIDGALNNYLVFGAPMLGLALTFERDSRFWRNLPPLENSVFQLACSDNNTEFEPLNGAELARYTSSSSGSRYYLGWSRAAATIKFRGTDVFDRLLSNPVVAVPQQQIAQALR